MTNIKNKKITKFLINNKHLSVFLLFAFLSIYQLLENKPLTDEWLYYRETIVISEFISSFKWFGNESVGTHGFIFKIPPAIVLILTGPTVYIPIAFHHLLSFFSLVLFYKISLHLLKDTKLVFYSILFFSTSALFINYGFSYLREAPTLFTIALLTYCVLKKKNPLVLGFCLMLVFDAKEYVGFLVMASLLIYFIFEEWKSRKSIAMFFGIYFSKSALNVLPSTILYILMYNTSIVPENNFASDEIFQITSYKSLGWSYKPAFSKDLLEHELKSVGALKNDNREVSKNTSPNIIVFDASKQKSEKYAQTKSLVKYKNEPAKKSIQTVNNINPITVSNDKRVPPPINKTVTEKKKTELTSLTTNFKANDTNVKTMNRIMFDLEHQIDSNNIMGVNLESLNNISLIDSSSKFSNLYKNDSINNSKKSVSKQINKESNNIKEVIDVKVARQKPSVKIIKTEKQLNENIVNHSDTIITQSNVQSELSRKNQIIEEKSGFISQISSRINYYYEYIFLVFSKIFINKTFNFETFPMVVIIASLFSFIYIAYNWKISNEWAFIAILFLAFFTFFIARPTHARYLFPALLTVPLLFTFFLDRFSSNTTTMIVFFLISLIGNFAQFVFFSDELPLKFYPNTLAVLLFGVALLFQNNQRIRILFVTSVFIFAMSFSYGMYNLNNLNKAMEFDENTAKELSSHFDVSSTERVYFLSSELYIDMVKFYLKDINTGFYDSSLENRYLLDPKIPKFHLNSYYKPNMLCLGTVFNGSGESYGWEMLKKVRMDEFKVTSIALIVSVKEEDINEFIVDESGNLMFPDGNRDIEKYFQFLIKTQPDWIKLEKKVELLNGKELFMFQVLS